MFFSISLTSYNYVTTLYGIIKSLVENDMNKTVYVSFYAFVLLYFAFCNNIILVASQNLRNEWLILQRRLSKLYSTLSIYSTPEAKSLKNLYILVKNNPIQIQFISKIFLGMHLAPIVLSLSVTYAIIILQFSQLCM
ncbi:unnamed protein product [Chrysodeixis includens]|uniref:Gustatory receptor n=1 Tax=Chrysodeixis includens TaxID=689277 RepID=A0A9P0BV37_CHRIL|nr:unnamed protein product [Chrysodeixis includens]